MKTLLLVFAVIGCGGAVSDPADAIILTEVEPHPSSGVLLYDEAALDPWCGAVLVRRDAVLTAAHCVKAREPESMQFTVDDHRSPEARSIRSSAIHPEYHGAEEDLRVDLAILTLEDPIDDREPAQIGDGGEVSEPLSLITTIYTARGQPFAPSLARGTLVDGPPGMISVRFPLLSVACHGESGTALYSGSRLVGIGAGGFASEPPNEFGCLDVLTFAPVAGQIERILER